VHTKEIDYILVYIYIYIDEIDYILVHFEEIGEFESTRSIEAMLAAILVDPRA
jgi:hypothetical protein